MQYVAYVVNMLDLPKSFGGSFSPYFYDSIGPIIQNGSHHLDVFPTKAGYLLVHIT